MSFSIHTQVSSIVFQSYIALKYFLKEYDYYVLRDFNCDDFELLLTPDITPELGKNIPCILLKRGHKLCDYKLHDYIEASISNSDNENNENETNINGSKLMLTLQLCERARLMDFVYSNSIKLNDDARFKHESEFGETNICNKGVNCSHYIKFKYNYDYNESSLSHLQNKYHEDKDDCKYGENCYAYQRLFLLSSSSNGTNKCQLFKDICHTTIYNHPPRDRVKKLLNKQSSIFKFDKLNDCELQDKINFEMVKSIDDEWANMLGVKPKIEHDIFTLYKPDGNDLIKLSQESDFVNELIKEVIKNGYGKEICKPGTVNTGTSNINNCNIETKWIFNLINEKMNHPRHVKYGQPLNRGEILALILYTGTDCNYNLCKCLREFKNSFNYCNKWKWFDYCLHYAISKLSLCEYGNYSVYSGINNIEMKEKAMKGQFLCYVSTTRNKKIAHSFMNGNGMLITISNRNKFCCCDVSWISKFEYEKEVLFSFRSRFNCFKAKIKNNVISKVSNNNSSNNVNSDDTNMYQEILMQNLENEATKQKNDFEQSMNSLVTKYKQVGLRIIGIGFPYVKFNWFFLSKGIV